MQILALDVATHCGWAHTCGESGTWDCSVKKNDSSGMRLIYFRKHLEYMQQIRGVDLVAYEGAIQMPGNRSGGSVQAEMQGVLKLWCEDHKVEYKSYSPPQIKRFATNKGNANKLQMIDAAEQRWKRTFSDKDDNEVDALWLLELAKWELGLGC